jgi:phospholipid/cholesterol/gamma-HCH transport system permease protein
VAGRTQVLLARVAGRLVERVKLSVLGVQDYALLSARGLRGAVTRPDTREIVAQMDVLGVQSLTIVVLTGMFTGMVLTLQSAASLDAFGARHYVGQLVCVSMVRELGPVLTVVSNAVGLLGGAVIAVANLGINWVFFWRSAFNHLVLNDLVMGMSKPLVFGFITASIGCHMGLSTTGGTRGVGLATTRLVVASSVAILVSDFFMTKLLLVFFPVK